MAKKTFILDTNILLSDPEAIFSFQNNNIVLPLIVCEELDRHKDRQDEVGRNARETVRKLAELTKTNKDLKTGIPLPSGGLLKILSIDDVRSKRKKQIVLPQELLMKETGDNSIISLCLEFQSAHEEEDMTLVSRDLLLRLKADVLGIKCEDYKKVQVTSSVSKLFSGVSTIEGDFDINELHRSGQLYLEASKTAGLQPNEFVVLTNGTQSGLCRFFENGEPLVLVSNEHVGKIKSRNKEQTFAIDLLTDPDVKLVTLAGFAGCGKTLVAIAAGLEQVMAKKYKSLVVCRPVQPVGKDIGFLPGTIEEKMEPWIAPIKDNLRFLLSPSGKRSKNIEETLNLMFDDGIIEIQAMTFIRGRSIADAYMIIDEAQNLNAHELKTILTRVGEGTKIVLTGDIEQIDNMYVDSLSNGLTVAIEKFKSYPISGHVTLLKGERSELATLAAQIL